MSGLNLQSALHFGQGEQFKGDVLTSEVTGERFACLSITGGLGEVRLFFTDPLQIAKLSLELAKLKNLLNDDATPQGS